YSYSLFSLHLFTYYISSLFFFFSFNHTSTSDIYTLSLHDALPITTLQDNYFTIKLSPQHPIIVVKSKLGDTMQSFNLSQEELKSGTIDLTIKNNLNKKLNEMNKDMDDMLNSNSNTASPFMGLWYYPGQMNGHKYRAGVHVQCNDFNGPANSSHYYWSRRSGNIAAAKALKNFVG